MGVGGTPILVTGATGNTGSVLADLLTRRGVPVRAMVRREADAARFAAMPAPVSVAVADFDDADSLAAAVAGVGKVYLVTPSSERAAEQQVRFAEIAEALSTATGRQITFVDAPPEVFAESLRELLPPWQVGGLLEDYAHYARGEAAAVYPTVAEVTGRQPRDIGQFARDYADAFAPG